MSEIHIDDQPILRATVKDQNLVIVDISAATTLEIKLRAPSEAVGTAYTATLSTDGLDGRMQITVGANVFNAAGLWELQVRLIKNGLEYNSNVVKFRVYSNL